MEPGTIRSARNLAKLWGVSRRTAQFKLHNEGEWKKVNPLDVGSMKQSVNVWKKN